MKSKTTDFIEKCRIKTGPMRSSSALGFNGAFFIPSADFTKTLKVVCSDGEGWEHVSVSLPNRSPTWEEMCYIKSVFWDEEEAVMQIHPPKSEYVNNAKYCLHLWRPTGAVIPLPPKLMVGDKALGTLD